MLMSDIQGKDIINSSTGTNLGRIIDIDILENGNINYFVVGSLKFIKRIGNAETKINYDSIIKIGKDVILVDLK